jgi:hypothetical protein
MIMTFFGQSDYPWYGQQLSIFEIAIFIGGESISGTEVLGLSNHPLYPTYHGLSLVDCWYEGTRSLSRLP